MNSYTKYTLKHEREKIKVNIKQTRTHTHTHKIEKNKRILKEKIHKISHMLQGKRRDTIRFIYMSRVYYRPSLYFASLAAAVSYS